MLAYSRTHIYAHQMHVCAKNHRNSWASERMVINLGPSFGVEIIYYWPTRQLAMVAGHWSSWHCTFTFLRLVHGLVCLLKTKCSAIPHGGQGSTCQCKQRKLYLSYTRILAVPHIDKSALICCVEYIRNSKKSSPLINNVEKYKFDAGAGVSVAHSRLSMPRNAVQHYLE